MTLLRTISVLAGALVVMLAVVILRAETTRLHYEISRREARVQRCRQQLREAELELARLRNPMMIRARVRALVAEYLDEAAPPAADASSRR